MVSPNVMQEVNMGQSRSYIRDAMMPVIWDLSHHWVCFDGTTDNAVTTMKTMASFVKFHQPESKY